MSRAGDEADDFARTAAAEPDGSAPVGFPPITVRTWRGDVEAFSRATGQAQESGAVPLAFPFRWLALPAIRAFIVRSAGGEGFLPVHEAQSFAYERPLQIDADYVLAGEARRSASPPRLSLRMTVSTPQGESCLGFETVLRIVPAPLRPPA